MRFRQFWMVLLASMVLAPGCSTVTVKKFPAYGLATQMTGPERPKIIVVEQADIAHLPSIVPYAVIIVQSPMAVSLEDQFRRLWREGQKIGADIVAVSDRGAQQVGTLSNYYGFGVTYSEPVYSKIASGFCYRVPRARLGCGWDGQGMVKVLTQDGPAKQAGLLEGDGSSRFSVGKVVASRNERGLQS